MLSNTQRNYPIHLKFGRVSNYGMKMSNLVKNNKLMLPSLIIHVYCQTRGIYPIYLKFSNYGFSDICALSTLVPSRNLCPPDICVLPDICAYRHFCPPTLVPTDTFAHRHFCPPTLLPTDTFAHRHFCPPTTFAHRHLLPTDICSRNICAHCIIFFCDQLIILSFVYPLSVVFALCKKTVFISKNRSI